MKFVAARAVSHLVVLFILATEATAQVNSWTKPTSGAWHEPFWSLGVLPASNQIEIMLTNAGWKAVAIDRTTVRSHPSSLRIARLTLSSPTSSFNTLLLNFAGNETPLQIADSVVLSSNAAITVLDSGVQVGSEFHIGGIVNHADFSVIRAPVVFLGDGGAGAYNLTNGILSVPDRLFVGYAAPGVLTQHGGSNLASQIRVRSGEYFLQGGDAIAGDVFVGERAEGFLRQSGGRLFATNRVILGGEPPGYYIKGFGHYVLSGGSLHTPRLQIGVSSIPFSGNMGGDGEFEQTGGSNYADSVYVGGAPGRSTYTLVNGLLATSGTMIGGDFGLSASFTQSGGVHRIDGKLGVEGHEGREFGQVRAVYNLSGGRVSSRGLNMSIATFTHSGGTNEVMGELLIEPSRYSPWSSYLLGAGTLQTSNTIVFDGFAQTGGTHVVNGMLAVHRAGFPSAYETRASYTLVAGELRVRDIQLHTNAVFDHIGGTVSHSGTLTLVGAQWNSAPGHHQFGSLQLKTASAKAILALTNGATTLRFLASGVVAWDLGAELLITNWRGSTNGGGQHRIVFGSSSAGLTPQQLSQVYFIQPAGLPPLEYSATIVASGEIVPLLPTGRFPEITLRRSGGHLRLEWPSRYTLQQAANIFGPFVDVNIPSPHFVFPDNDPQQFYRLRQQ